MANEENLQREIATLERALREAAKQADTVQSALDDLEGHRNELSGRLATAREAASDYASQLDERRQQLARALRAEAQARLLEAVDLRDNAANRVAEGILQLIASFERLDAARDEVAERAAETHSHLGRRPEVAPEPEELELEWARLIDFVREQAQLALDDELVDAAVSSPLGHEIQKLPDHLQVIARRRWQERIRAARGDTTHNNRD
jgi:chromosome segregation ATPase